LAEDKHDHKAAEHEAHADHMLESYAALSTALYKDDLASAKKAAAGIVKQDKEIKNPYFGAKMAHCGKFVK
jgi:hypothetical protein